MKMIRILLFMVFSVFFGCMPKGTDEPQIPIVTVDGVSLTYAELRNAIPENLSYNDSMAIAEDFISRWIRTKLILRQAEINLTPSEKNVEHLLDEYRTSLLVHQYQLKILEQKHSPLVTSREILQYYDDMKDNFNLQENIIRGFFIKVPKNAPSQNVIKPWMQSNANEDIISLEAYCFQNARKYEQFVENWIPFSRINTSLPEPIINEERFLRGAKFYETSDELYNYYLAVHDFKLAGTSAPLSFVEDRIRSILLNHKRIEFIQELGQELYEEGLRDKIVNFH